MLEWAKYSAYGVPFGLPGGDTDSDGDCDSTDVTQIQTWIDAPAYDVRGDLDLDGDVDATDKSTVQGSYDGTTTGWEVLSAVGSRAGYAGYMLDGNGLWHVRHRVLDPGLGRWLRRDPLGYMDGISLYEYIASVVIPFQDPLGLDGITKLLGTVTFATNGTASIDLTVDKGSLTGTSTFTQTRSAPIHATSVSDGGQAGGVGPDMPGGPEKLALGEIACKRIAQNWFNECLDLAGPSLDGQDCWYTCMGALTLSDEECVDFCIDYPGMAKAGECLEDYKTQLNNCKQHWIKNLEP